jgi:hypothetical protein
MLVSCLTLADWPAPAAPSAGDVVSDLLLVDSDVCLLVLQLVEIVLVGLAVWIFDRCCSGLLCGFHRVPSAVFSLPPLKD